MARNHNNNCQNAEEREGVLLLPSVGADASLDHHEPTDNKDAYTHFGCYSTIFKERNKILH